MVPNDWAPWIARRGEKPLLKRSDGPAGASTIAATHPVLGAYDLHCEGDAPLLFTENSTNHARLHLDFPDDGAYHIGVFDRSAPLPTGGYLEQADGTAWMALFTQNMLELAVELAGHDPTYEDMVLKFVEHFLYIVAAMNKSGADGMWDEEDGYGQEWLPS